MASYRKSHVFRVTGLSRDLPDEDLQASLQRGFNDNFTDEERSQIKAEITIVPSCYENDTQRVALVHFRGGVPRFLTELTTNPLGDWQIEMGAEDINFDSHFFGFTQLYAPDDEKPVIADIIAIAGLDGHAYGSWQGRGNLGRMWLRDFLSKDLPQCRTMIYGYNSKLSSHGVDTILDYGRELMEEIKKIRNTTKLQQRPLFFIAYSFGGIIMAHCLVRAVQTMEEDHPAITSLHRATYGMILFSIPHKGLVVDDIQQMMAAEGQHPREQLLQQISRKSDLLILQLADFKNLIRDRKVVSFYETEQTRRLVFDKDSGRWKRTGDFVTTVDADSALLQLPDHVEDKVPVHADHSLIVKFDMRTAVGYQSTLDKLRGFVHDAPRVVTARFTQARRKVFGFCKPVGVCLGQAPAIDSELFIGRESELEKMKEILRPGDGTQKRRTLVLGGIGGIGKTQLAIAYAERHRNIYDSVFWLTAASEATLKESFGSMANLIFEKHEDLENEQIIIRVHQWLSDTANAQWLLIFDNYDDPYQLKIEDYYPPASHGTIIITAQQPERFPGKSLQVSRIQRTEDSLDILRTRSKRDDVNSDPYAKRLAERLDGVPLALATAGAYLQKSSLTFESYLRVYEKHWDQLNKHRLPEYSGLLYTTWNVSYTRLKSHHPNAAKLLKLLAYFNNRTFSYQLLHAGLTDASPRWLHEVVGSGVEFDEVMRKLVETSLVELQPSGTSWSMHGCVHDWTLAELNKRADSQQYWYAFTCVARSIKSCDWGSFGRINYSSLAAHATRLVQIPLPFNNDIDRLDNAYRIVQLLREQVQLEAAEQMCLQMLEGYKRTMGLNYKITLDTMHCLGNIYYDQDKLKEAEEMYRQALEGYERILGPDNATTLLLVNNFGNLYRNQGKLNEAKKMYQRALEAYEKVLGPESISTLDTIHYLGNLYSDQNKLEKAERMYQRALTGYEKILGPDHVSTLLTVNNFGNLCRNHGKLKDAEKMYQRALEGYEKLLGPDHKFTLELIHCFGILHQKQRKLKEAEEMYRRALEGYENTLGSDHKSTLDTIHCLGNLYYDQDKPKEAEEMYRRALKGYENTLGSDHKSTLDTIHCLGNLYYDQDKPKEAEEMYLRALEGYKRTMGLNYKITLDTMHCLGNLSYDQNKLKEAEEMYRQALEGYERILGPDNATTLLLVNNFGNLYRNQGKLNEAKKMYQRALEAYEKVLGLENISTLDTMHCLGILYRKQRKLNEAERMYQRALEGYENTLGSDHASTLLIVNNFGNLYADQNKLEESEKKFRRALEGYEKTLGPDHKSTLESVYCLGILYQKQGKQREAEKMYKRALAGYEKSLHPNHTRIQRLRKRLNTLKSSGRSSPPYNPIR